MFFFLFPNLHILNFKSLFFNIFILDVENKSFYFEDLYFKRILDTFKKYSRKKYVPQKIFKEEIPRFLLVTNDLKPDDYWNNQFHHITSECPLPCKFTRNVSEVKNVDAVVIHLDTLLSRSILEYNLGVRDPKQPWVMMTFETPLMANKTYRLRYNDFNNLFNRTMTYRRDSDVIITHGFVVSQEDSKYLPYHWRVSWEHTQSIYSKPSKVAVGTLLSNCKDTSGRLKYIKMLQKYIDVDIYGECGKLKCGTPLYVASRYKPYTDRCLKKLGREYKFYLAFENSFCKDYGSEKIYNILYYPVIPIVYGGIKYSEILPPHSYINAADYSPEELADYLNYLLENPQEYNKYFEWKDRYVSSTIGGERITCDLCTKLHDPNFYNYKVIEDFKKWFIGEADCKVFGYRYARPHNNLL